MYGAIVCFYFWLCFCLFLWVGRLINICPSFRESWLLMHGNQLLWVGFLPLSLFLFSPLSLFFFSFQAAHSLSALVRSYFAIKSECEAAYSKVELVTVKVRLARQTHDIVVVVRFEGMLCECQLRLAALLRLKDLTHIPTAVLRLPDENSPVPKMPIFIKPDDGDGGWNFAEELNADSFELIISYKRI